jgi:hypothetical protein
VLLLFAFSAAGLLYNEPQHSAIPISISDIRGVTKNGVCRRWTNSISRNAPRVILGGDTKLLDLKKMSKLPRKDQTVLHQRFKLRNFLRKCYIF